MKDREIIEKIMQLLLDSNMWMKHQIVADELPQRIQELIALVPSFPKVTYGALNPNE